MTHDLAVISAWEMRMVTWTLVTVAALLVGCSSEPTPSQTPGPTPSQTSVPAPSQPSEAAARQDSQSGRRTEDQFKAQENQLIDGFVKEYKRDPAKYDRSAAQIISDIESVQAEAARMRSQHGITESEWAAASRELSRGRPLSQPLYNSHVLEYILRKR